ncbi:MAG: S1C family serine protease [Phycisphaerae bacterium]
MLMPVIYSMLFAAACPPDVVSDGLARGNAPAPTPAAVWRVDAPARRAVVVPRAGAAITPRLNWRTLDGAPRGMFFTDDAQPLKRVNPGADVERRAWIGVKLSPLPAPLAAHVGDAGLMILNVAKDSPADAAGIEQYDVVRSFNGEAITTMESLIDAISALGADRSARLTLVRKGSEKTLAIKTAAPRDPATVEYKFDEPEQELVDRSSSLRGRTLQIDPDGQVRIGDLGPITNLPDDVWKLFGGPTLRDWNTADPWSRLHIDLDHDGAQAKIELKMSVSEDGNTITVTRDAEGRITVDRVDAEGKNSSASYENADALREADPDAYEVLSRAGGGLHWQAFSPRAMDLPKMQKLFQDRFGQQLRVDPRGANRLPVVPRERRALRQPATERPRADAPPPATDDANARDGMSVTINGDGEITVVIRKDGQTVTHEFRNKEDFKKREPQLFERYEKLSR